MSNRARNLTPPPLETPAPLSLALVQVNLFLNEVRMFIQEKNPPTERETRAERREDGPRISKS